MLVEAKRVRCVLIMVRMVQSQNLWATNANTTHAQGSASLTLSRGGFTRKLAFGFEIPGTKKTGLHNRALYLQL